MHKSGVEHINACSPNDKNKKEAEFVCEYEKETVNVSVTNKDKIL